MGDAAFMQEAIELEEGRPVEVEVSIKKRYPWTEHDRRLSHPSEAVLDLIGRHFAPVTEDRSISRELGAVATLVRSGAISAAAAEFVDLDD